MLHGQVVGGCFRLGYREAQPESLSSGATNSAVCGGYGYTSHPLLIIAPRAQGEPQL
jgi:hypothetical protein